MKVKTNVDSIKRNSDYPLVNDFNIPALGLLIDDPRNEKSDFYYEFYISCDKLSSWGNRIDTIRVEYADNGNGSHPSRTQYNGKDVDNLAQTGEYPDSLAFLKEAYDVIIRVVE